MQQRHGTIDGLRGLAVMGILLMNIASFALPSGAYFNPVAGGGHTPADIALWAAGFVLVDGKMRALFSILFGASTAIVVGRAEAAGLSPTRVHLARMAVLALFGAAHLLLVWPGDILLHYALIGAFALPLVGLEPRQQLHAAILLLLVQLVVGLLFSDGFLALRSAALHPGADAASLEAWRSFVQGVGIASPADVAHEVARMRGPWTGLVRDSLSTAPAGIPFLLAFDGPETLAFMLIGMAALQSGFLTGAWTRARYLRWAALGFGIGLPPTIALCWACFALHFDTLATFTAGTLGGIAFRPILALAEASLALAWLAGGDSPLRRRFRAAGRTAFSNYLGTSLLMTALFDGWGLGLFGRLGRTELLVPVAATWVAMLVWSPLWLSRYRYGPLEWAWRSLARGEIQPMRRNDIASVSQ